MKQTYGAATGLDSNQAGWNAASRPARRNAGFTMAEMLSAVAILVILCGVAFVAIWQTQIQMRQVSLDGTAKEIYTAAQNHLALAESQGLLDNSSRTSPNRVNLGTLADASETKDSVYFFVHDQNAPVNSTSGALELMLPFGSIDETVRVGGSYIIRYQPSTGLVLDVFYADDCDFDVSTKSDLDSFLNTYKSDKVARQDYGGHIIGYYGGEQEGSTALRLKAPTVKVDNGDALTVTVTNPSTNSALSLADTQMRLIVTGKTSKAAMWFGKDASQTLTVTLDDVTTISSPAGGGRFYQLAGSVDAGHRKADADGFIPGEDLEIQAWVTSKNTAVKAMVAKSAKVTTNSLFATGELDRDTNTYTATINSFRHLANLSGEVSQFNATGTASTYITLKTYPTVKATQTTDLKWTNYVANCPAASTVGIYYGGSTSTGANVFFPVKMSSPNTLFTYDGTSHQVYGVTMSDGGGAMKVQDEGGNTVSVPMGLFDSLIKKDSKIENLELVNSTVSATGGNAGVLVGEIAAGTTVSNVLVRDDLQRGQVVSVTTTSGNAGGLVGYVNGGTVSDCAASVYVKADSGAAGGLIGSATRDTTGDVVTNSYSGGHTTGGAYSADQMNVMSTSGNAGGLVGTLSGNITNCYSTCSVSGATAGGLVGGGSGAITNCYATGLVTGSTAAGALVGTTGVTLSMSGTNNDVPTNYYLDTINHPDLTVSGMPPVAGDESSTASAIAADSSTDAYNALAGYGSSVPYDTARVDAYGGQYDAGVTLAVAYNAKYPFKNISQLTTLAENEGKLTKHLTIHYGDWPSLETLVINN